MVNTGLDRKYVAKEGGQTNFDPIPEGDYRLRVKEIDPWKSTIKTIKVNKRDENGNAIKDEKGNNVTETVPNCEFYNCTAKLEIVGGEYNGRIIFADDVGVKVYLDIKSDEIYDNSSVYFTSTNRLSSGNYIGASASNSSKAVYNIKNMGLENNINIFER